jgi:hypothetical protein
MRAFISYSINDTDQYVLTLLSSKLRGQGFIITTSQNFYNKRLDQVTMNAISECHLFIGIIMRQSMEKNRVIDEWKFSKRKNIPNLILIEDNVRIQDGFQGNYIRFSRNNPKAAVDKINSKMQQRGNMAQRSNDDSLSWILGGAALLAIISLIAGEDSKK